MLRGTLVRTETKQMVVGYTLDPRVNKLAPELAPNPSAAKQHLFSTYRMNGDGHSPVSMVDVTPPEPLLALGDDE